MNRFLACLAFSLGCCGCASLSLPTATISPPTLPAEFSPPLAASTSSEAISTWWKQLNDPQLTGIIARALEHNRDIAIAQASIQEARAMATVVVAGALPNFTLDNRVSRSGFSKNSLFGEAFPSPFSQRQAGMEVRWETDLFGAIAHRKEAAEKTLEAVAARSGMIAVSVAAAVVDAYIELRAAQAQQQLLTRLVAAGAEMEQLITARERAGLASGLDTIRAHEQLAAIKAELPLAISRAEVAMRQLGVLVAGESHALHEELSPTKPFPETTLPVPSQVPAALLERRPDIVAAAHEWQAALARMAGADADRLPTFSLGGTLGLLSLMNGGFFSTASRFWDLGAALRAPLYSPVIQAQVAVERARAKRLAIAYEQAATNAVLEVEEAAQRLQQSQHRAAQMHSAVAASTTAMNLAQSRYQQGLGDFILVLDAVRSRVSLERQLIEARADTYVHYVALHKALGGGWQEAPL